MAFEATLDLTVNHFHLHEPDMAYVLIAIRRDATAPIELRTNLLPHLVPGLLQQIIATAELPATPRSH